MTIWERKDPAQLNKVVNFNAYLASCLVGHIEPRAGKSKAETLFDKTDLLQVQSCFPRWVNYDAPNTATHVIQHKPHFTNFMTILDITTIAPLERKAKMAQAVYREQYGDTIPSFEALKLILHTVARHSKPELHNPRPSEKYPEYIKNPYFIGGIVEVGSGNGFWAAWLRSILGPGTGVVALETDAKVAELLKAKAHEMPVYYYPYSVEELFDNPFRGERQTTVKIEHVPRVTAYSLFDESNYDVRFSYTDTAAPSSTDIYTVVNDFADHALMAVSVPEEIVCNYLRAYTGNWFFWIYDSAAPSSELLWGEIADKWQMTDMVRLPSWPGEISQLWLYRRKLPAGTYC